MHSEKSKELYNIIEEDYENNPDEYKQLCLTALKEWCKYDEKAATEAMDLVINGKHLTMEMLNKGLMYLTKYTNVSTPVWSEADFKNWYSGEYPYDVNFIAQYKYATHHKTLGSDPKVYIKMAIDEINLDSEYAHFHYEELCDKYE